jgi:ABC-2 type transport system permease protein
MYWAHVARKEFADAVRSRMFWGLSVVMILFAYLGLYAPTAFADDPSADTGIQLLGSPMLVLVPIISLIVGYMAIVSERENGSIRMVLSLPLKRGEVLVGKFVGRTAVVTVPILLGFVLAIPFVYLLYGTLPAGVYTEFVFRTVLTAILFVALAVGISGSFDTRGKALAAVIGVFVVFEYIWGVLPLAIQYALTGELPSGTPPDWYEFVLRLAPGEATAVVADALFSLSIATDESILLQEWVAGIIVVAWILVPLSIGYSRFKRANIG